MPLAAVRGLSSKTSVAAETSRWRPRPARYAALRDLDLASMHEFSTHLSGRRWSSRSPVTLDRRMLEGLGDVVEVTPMTSSLAEKAPRAQPRPAARGYYWRAVGILDPKPTPYDPIEWSKLPFDRKATAVARAWASDGYGAPPASFAMYAVKIALFVAAWFGFCSLSSSLGGPTDVGSWWSHPVAFQKAIIWSLAFEVLGFGCGSGPLTGRYFPPLGGVLYFLRPGTIKAPLFPGVPLIGGRTRRLPFEVLGYVALLVLLGWQLGADAPSRAPLFAIAVLVAVLGVLDKTIFLAARGEHYWTTIVCFVIASNWLPGAQAVALALWFWAGVSKLNRHFPAVVCVMASNSPVTRFSWFRRLMYRDIDTDLRPSRLAVAMAHAGAALELGVPIVFVASAVAGGSPTLTVVGLVMMVVLHTFITSNVPMGVPLEWNVLVVYAGFVLFGAHSSAAVFDLDSPILALFLLAMLVVIPLVGNLAPRLVSFLLSMRYYAGNWAYSVWFFRGDSYRKLESNLTMTSPWIYDQLDRFYDRSTAVGMVGKVIGFRLMHLHGRALVRLVPKAVPEFNDYEWVDGEIVAGLVLGWNFGDGHLHDHRLLASVQAKCGFASEELRCIFVESQPLGRAALRYRIVDANDGELFCGEIAIGELLSIRDFGTLEEPGSGGAVSPPEAS